MKKLIPVFVVAILIIGGITVATRGGQNEMNDAMQPRSDVSKMDDEMQQTNAVSIESFAYAPANIVVKKGTTVTWTNNDEARHNVAFDTGSLKGTEGKLLAKGETYSMTFDEAGTYEYHCRPHPYMKATVTVEE